MLWEPRYFVYFSLSWMLVIYTPLIYMPYFLYFHLYWRNSTILIQTNINIRNWQWKRYQINMQLKFSFYGFESWQSFIHAIKLQGIMGLEYHIILETIILHRMRTLISANVLVEHGKKGITWNVRGNEWIIWCYGVWLVRNGTFSKNTLLSNPINSQSSQEMKINHHQLSIMNLKFLHNHKKSTLHFIQWQCMIPYTLKINLKHTTCVMIVLFAKHNIIQYVWHHLFIDLII